jgi:subtilisin family serine protease
VDKIDPVLVDLIESYAAGELPADPDNPDFLVHVYLIAENGDFSGIASAGHEITSELAGSAIVTLPISSIESLADRADVLAILAPPVGNPRADPVLTRTTAQWTTHMKEAWEVTSNTRPTGSQGEGVIIGIVDHGVNVLHDAFTFEVDEAGKKVRKTRILSYWAQGATTSSGSTPLWQRNGTVFSEAAINGHIATFAATGTMPPAKLRGDHGTATASVAAGAAWSASPEFSDFCTGVAPDAQLVVVNAEIDVLAGIEFCFETARKLSLPCVVNVSLGHHEYPHNGLSLFSRRLRGMLVQGLPASFIPGRAFVIAAGNEGHGHNHLKLALTQMKELEIEVDAKPKESLFNVACLISSSTPGLRLSLAPPTNPRQFSSPGPFAGKQMRSGQRIAIKSVPSLPRQGLDDLPPDFDNHIFVEADRPSFQLIRPGTWLLRLDPGTTPHPEVHVWLTTGVLTDEHRLSDPEFSLVWAKEDDISAHFLQRRKKEDIETTLTGDSTSRDAIVVGMTTFYTDLQIDVPHRGSSRGPSTLPSGPDDSKPDLVAPGAGIVSALFKKSAKSLKSRSTRVSGTSIAAPMVTGAVALMLSHDRSLGQDEIRRLLRANTAPWPAIVHEEAFINREISELNIAGKGFLDMEKVIKAVKARLGP